MEKNVYNPKPDTFEHLKPAISREMRKTTPEMCVNVFENFRKRLDVVDVALNIGCKYCLVSFNKTDLMYNEILKSLV